AATAWSRRSRLRRRMLHRPGFVGSYGGIVKTLPHCLLRHLKTRVRSGFVSWRSAGFPHVGQGMYMGRQYRMFSRKAQGDTARNCSSALLGWQTLFLTVPRLLKVRNQETATQNSVVEQFL